LLGGPELKMVMLLTTSRHTSACHREKRKTQ